MTHTVLIFTNFSIIRFRLERDFELHKLIWIAQTSFFKMVVKNEKDRFLSLSMPEHNKLRLLQNTQSTCPPLYPGHIENMASLFITR